MFVWNDHLDGLVNIVYPGFMSWLFPWRQSEYSRWHSDYSLKSPNIQYFSSVIPSLGFMMFDPSFFCWDFFIGRVRGLLCQASAQMFRMVLRGCVRLKVRQSVVHLHRCAFQNNFTALTWYRHDVLILDTTVILFKCFQMGGNVQEIASFRKKIHVHINLFSGKIQKN